VSSIPRCFIFDVEGMLVYDGYPSGDDFDKVLKKSLRMVADPAKVATVTGPLIAQRAWTNSEGREIKAAVKAADDRNVTFIMANNKEVVYALDKLSDESRETIAAALAEANKPKEEE